MTSTLKASAVAQDDRIKVWDPVVRIFYWSLVVAFFVAYFTADDYRNIHEWSGYVVLGLIACRLVWGVIGSRKEELAKASSSFLTYSKYASYNDTICKKLAA